MNILNIQDRLLMQVQPDASGSSTTGNAGVVIGANGLESNSLYTKQGGDGKGATIGSSLSLAEAQSGQWTKIINAADFVKSGDDGKYKMNEKEVDNTSVMLNNILGKKGEGQDSKKGGPTFSDLRALNALAANKIQRVPQSMPIAQMTRIDPLRRSSEMEKQKQDAQANANAARVLGPKGSDPTLNVAQSMGLTEQLNKATMDANLQQSQSMSQQRGVQREQTDYANKLNVLNQNTRIEIRNAAEKKKAGNIATQRLANAQIGNTWLGAKEKEKQVQDQTNLLLFDKYAQYAFNTDPANQDVIKEKAAAADIAYKADAETKLALDALTDAKYNLEHTDAEGPAKKPYEDAVTAAQLVYNEKKKLSDAAFTTFETAKQKYATRQTEFNNKVGKGEFSQNMNQNKVGYTGAEDRTEQLFNDIDKNTTTVKPKTNQKGGIISRGKGGANEALKQQYRIELANIKHGQRQELLRQTFFAKSLVMPEPKAYYLSIKMIAEKNKQINDMFKDAYKAFRLR